MPRSSVSRKHGALACIAYRDTILSEDVSCEALSLPFHLAGEVALLPILFDEFPDRDFLVFWNFSGSRKANGIDDFAFAFGLTILKNWHVWSVARRRLLRNYRDGPTLERAGPLFVHGPNHARDGRSHKRQRHFLTPVLGIAGASRLDRIGRFDCLHTVTKIAVRETFPRQSNDISETLSKDSRSAPKNTGTSTACASANSG
jgi:hypothetical protein